MRMYKPGKQWTSWVGVIAKNSVLDVHRASKESLFVHIDSDIRVNEFKPLQIADNSFNETTLLHYSQELAFRDAEINVPIHSIGVPLEFIEHSKRGEIMSDLGITAQNITHQLVSWSSSLKDQLNGDVMPAKQLPLDEKPGR